MEKKTKYIKSCNENLMCTNQNVGLHFIAQRSKKESGYLRRPATTVWSLFNVFTPFFPLFKIQNEFLLPFENIQMKTSSSFQIIEFLDRQTTMFFLPFSSTNLSNSVFIN